MIYLSSQHLLHLSTSFFHCHNYYLNLAWIILHQLHSECLQKAFELQSFLNISKSQSILQIAATFIFLPDSTDPFLSF